MKKTATLGALLLALALPLARRRKPCSPAGDGGDDAGDRRAPYGGLVEDVRVRVGDSVKIGDPIATVETSKTYAPPRMARSAACLRAKATARTA